MFRFVAVVARILLPEAIKAFTALGVVTGTRRTPDKYTPRPDVEELDSRTSILIEGELFFVHRATPRHATLTHSLTHSNTHLSITITTNIAAAAVGQQIVKIVVVQLNVSNKHH